MSIHSFSTFFLLRHFFKSLLARLDSARHLEIVILQDWCQFIHFQLFSIEKFRFHNSLGSNRLGSFWLSSVRLDFTFKNRLLFYKTNTYSFIFDLFLLRNFVIIMARLYLAQFGSPRLDIQKSVIILQNQYRLNLFVLFSSINIHEPTLIRLWNYLTN